MFSDTFSENCTVYEMMYNKIVWPDISNRPKEGCNHTFTICNNNLYSTANNGPLNAPQY